MAGSVATGTFALSMSSTCYRVHQYLSVLSVFNMLVHLTVDLVYSPAVSHAAADVSIGCPFRNISNILVKFQPFVHSKRATQFMVFLYEITFGTRYLHSKQVV